MLYFLPSSRSEFRVTFFAHLEVKRNKIDASLIHERLNLIKLRATQL